MQKVSLLTELPRLKPGRVKDSERDGRASLALAEFRDSMPGLYSNNQVCAYVAQYMSLIDDGYKRLFQEWKALGREGQKRYGAFDYVLEKSDVPVNEFIATGRKILTSLSEESAACIFAAGLPKLARYAVKRAMSGTPDGDKLLIAILQKASLILPPPGVKINNTVVNAVNVQGGVSASLSPLMEKYAEQLRGQQMGRLLPENTAKTG